MTVAQFVATARGLMTASLRANYSSGTNMTPQRRYKGLAQTFDQIMDQAQSEFAAKAAAYYARRTPGDAALASLQASTKRELESCLSEAECLPMHRMSFEVVPASSFSARIHLAGESDIDFAVLVKNIDTNKVVCASNALGGCGFIYNDLRNVDSARHVHWVFQKYVGGVELEAKVRDKDGFREIFKMHDYLDNRLPQATRVMVTYVKHLLKSHSAPAYDMFKMFYYCQAAYHGGSRELMYPLE